MFEAHVSGQRNHAHRLWALMLFAQWYRLVIKQQAYKMAPRRFPTMNLCLYTATFLPTIGGAELILHVLASALASQGHSVTVLAPILRHADNRVEASYRLRRYQRPSSKRFGVHQVLFYLLHEYWRRPFDVLLRAFASVAAADPFIHWDRCRQPCPDATTGR